MTADVVLTSMTHGDAPASPAWSLEQLVPSYWRHADPTRSTPSLSCGLGCHVCATLQPTPKETLSCSRHPTSVVAHLLLRGLPSSRTPRHCLLPLPGSGTPWPLLLLVQHAAVQLLELLLQAPQLLLQLLCSLAFLSFEVIKQPVQAAVQLSLSTLTLLISLVQVAVQLSLSAQTQGCSDSGMASM